MRRWRWRIAGELRGRVVPGVARDEGGLTPAVAACVGDLHGLCAERPSGGVDTCASVLVFRRRLEGARHVVVARACNHSGEVSVLLDVEAADAGLGYGDVRERAAPELDL